MPLGGEQVEWNLADPPQRSAMKKAFAKGINAVVRVPTRAGIDATQSAVLKGALPPRLPSPPRSPLAPLIHYTPSPVAAFSVVFMTFEGAALRYMPFPESPAPLPPPPSPLTGLTVTSLS